MRILELMLAVKNLDAVLPEFQREYVWELEQAKQLFVSLFRDYPTGSLLFWKTTTPPDIKNNAIDREKIGSTNVILDGQQRLTTLYLLTQNAIPPYYVDADIKNDPRNLYFDLQTGDFQYFLSTKMKNAPNWIAVTECFTRSDINPFAIAKALASEEGQQFGIAQTINNNLNRLRNILEKSYPIQTVPSSANIDEAIDVFDRVNSLGTKLTDAELALAHICGKWPEARRVMKQQIEEYDRKQFYFDLTFMARALTAVVKGRALFETVHSSERKELEDGWKKLKRILEYLIAILSRHACIHSTEDLNTTNVLVPLVLYLSSKERFGDETELRRAVHWLYAANAWARYTGQTDQRLDHDLSLVRQSDSPWSKLVSAIIDQRGRIEVKASDLEGRSTQHPMYRMAYILIKTKGGIDWCNGHPLDLRQKGHYDVHSHHIFPLSRLYKEGGYEQHNQLDKQIVNEIANRAFLTGESNWSLSDDRPATYFPEVKQKYSGALANQFIPDNPELWKMDRYEDFLATRRKMLADGINSLMSGLLEEAGATPPVATKELIAAGESATLEFKSSLRWDVREQKVNKALQKVIAKTVAGFLNNDGGVLLIGIADDGAVLGIENDIASINRKDLDGFQQVLFETLGTFLGESVASYVDVAFENLDGPTVCRLNVETSQHPVYVSDGPSKEFYIRFGSSTRPLDIEEAQKYISEHWA